ncbi:MAG TPA: protein kinase [Planctomycetaceae bacterium]|nr:protein kinase [Planctomycetaceae bacterium]
MSAAEQPQSPEPADEATLVGFPVRHDAQHVAAQEVVDVAVSRFAEDVRLGRSPSVADYLRQYPQHAEELGELLPLIASLERWSVDKEIECVRSNFPEDFSNRQLGEYRVVREIGRGGMGVVFEAAHIKTGAPVAVKLLPFRFVADLPRRQAQFLREAETIASLHHRNIVPVFAFGHHEGYCYYVMQYVEGVNLDWVIKRLLAKDDLLRVYEILQVARGDDEPGAAKSRRHKRGVGRDSWTAFAKIGVQVAHALSHAHGAGVLHNDIKPANLLLDSTGRVIITDFGVGLRLENELTGETDHGTGTLRYMAPERFYGKSDPRSDVYALGATLYELLTLTPVYEARERSELVNLVLQSQPKPLRQVNPQIPVPLETIVLKALSRDPSERYPTAKAMAGELLRFINGRPILTRRPSRLREALGRVFRALSPQNRALKRRKKD